MSVTETFNWVLINGSAIEEQAVSVERIRETEKYTPKEAEWRQPGVDPKEEKWLKRGDVEFKELTLAYAPGLPNVLRGVNLTIKAGERVGVCGRTGAGKSSLAAALFNLVESWDGDILLDGVDVKPIGLHALRSQLTIIPQDPVLFNRSLRDNLDPAGAVSDERIWRALEQSQMAEVIKGLQGGLEHTVEEGGANFSVGQRQLLCLARALLRDSAIILLDEATASMDEDTDGAVQDTLLRELEGRTLIAIAHRLDTIAGEAKMSPYGAIFFCLGYDKILVMEAGRVKEFGPPSELMADERSVFRAMTKSQHD